MSTQLLEPILTGGIRNTNFFNGRLLTAEALSAEQTANRQQHQQLGQAIGSGIVRGLEVRLLNSGPQPVVQVKAGLALNRLGQALALAQDVEVALTADLPTRTTSAGLFAPCTPPGTVPVGSNAGVYMLVMSPASRYSTERAPLHGFADNGRVNGCGLRDTIEGVQFRLVFVDVNDANQVGTAMAAILPGLLGSTDLAVLSRLRNLLAHACLGTMEAANFTTNLTQYLRPNAQPPVYGVIGRLRTIGQLTDCDIPLALVFWTGRGIQFLDMWSVRRRLTKPTLSPLPHTNDQRLAEGEAAFWQFQEQIALLTTPTVPQSQLATIQAAQHFRFLPAVGIIPATGAGSPRGFQYLQFFKNLTVRQAVHIEGTKVQALLQRSFAYTPIDLTSGEMLWLYLVRQNMESINNNLLSSPQLYIVFTTGHMPFQGDAQYDLVRWHYSNYGLGVAGNFELGG